jgi:hypothetical protein
MNAKYGRHTALARRCPEIVVCLPATTVGLASDCAFQRRRPRDPRVKRQKWRLSYFCPPGDRAWRAYGPVEELGACWGAWGILEP